MSYSRNLWIDRPEDLVFAAAPRPVQTRRGLTIGGGQVYAELNFTLPPMEITHATFDRVCRIYDEAARGALARAAHLCAPGVVIEFETLPELTMRPDWARKLCGILSAALEDAWSSRGLPGALRATPNDLREMIRPPVMRSGAYWDSMLETFDACAEQGAELLSIESVGGKELHDTAVQYADLRQALFALCVLGVRDMDFVWSHVVRIAEDRHVRAAGDTACGFANTAMVLADRGMIPRVFAAVDRAVSVVRSLAAYDAGAVGPGKDCGYENAVLKALTGRPMSLEGKTAACAHLSPLGNLPMAYADLWSNESVAHTRLLGGMAPEVYMEQLIYDCRLLNRAAADGPDAARRLRDWLVESDAPLDPQAYILRPDNCIRLARAVAAGESPYAAGRAVAAEALTILRDALQTKSVRMDPREIPFLEAMDAALRNLPETEAEFISQMRCEIDSTVCRLDQYNLADPVVA
ncbi:MAG: methyltransferase MtaB domain-containing protein [Planctomycetota bacterium]